MPKQRETPAAPFEEEPAPRKIVTTAIVRQCKVELTKDELLEQGQRMAEATEAIERLERELDEFKSQMKGRVAEQAGIVCRSKSLIRDRFEFRDVDCEIVNDYDAGTVRVWRQDTGETIESRPMTSDEKSRLPL